MTFSNLSHLPTDISERRILTSKEAAAFCSFSLRGWRRLRSRGETPTAVRLGERKLGYTARSLVNWLEARTEKAAS